MLVSSFDIVIGSCVLVTLSGSVGYLEYAAGGAVQFGEAFAEVLSKKHFSPLGDTTWRYTRSTQYTMRAQPRHCGVECDGVPAA